MCVYILYVYIFLQEDTTDLVVYFYNIAGLTMDKLMQRKKKYHLFYSSSMSKSGAYITHNATTVGL